MVAHCWYWVGFGFCGNVGVAGLVVGGVWFLVWGYGLGLGLWVLGCLGLGLVRGFSWVGLCLSGFRFVTWVVVVG